MTRISLAFAALAILFATGLAPAPAAAEPRNCPPGLARRDPPCVPPGHARRDDDRRGDRYDDDRRGYRDDDAYSDDRRRGDRYESETYGRRLGERTDRAYRDGFRDGYRIARGERMRRGDYRLIENPRRYGLRPYRNDNWRYYLVRDVIVRADPDSRRILDVVGLAQVLLR